MNKRPLYKGREFATGNIIYFYSVKELEVFILQDSLTKKYSDAVILDYVYYKLREQGHVYINGINLSKTESEE